MALCLGDPVAAERAATGSLFRNQTLDPEARDPEARDPEARDPEARDLDPEPCLNRPRALPEPAPCQNRPWTLRPARACALPEPRGLWGLCGVSA